MLNFAFRALFVLAILWLIASWQPAAPAADRPPNIVLILADDLGCGDLACYGHPYARTPNLDELARQGTRFQQFYVTGITCCPSRTGFMTSKFPATFREYPAGGGFGSRVTITELLKKRGYQTGHFGKWHIGPDQKAGTYGIDTIGADDETRRGKKRDTRGRDAHIFDDAIRFIEQNRERPFYVNVWGHISHFPVDPPPAYVEKFQQVTVKESDFSDHMSEKFARLKAAGADPSERMRRYLADVFSLDEDIGRLLTKIDELGLRENTIVVFTSDHGPAPISDKGAAGDAPAKAKNKAGGDRSADARLNMLGYAGGLRGGKHTMYEGGVRVPLIVRWPGHVPAYRVDAKSVTSGIDWLPTLCSLTGISINAADFDGEDVSAAWLGKEHARVKPLLWKTSNPNSEIAIRDGHWKLLLPNRKRGEAELFNLLADAGERLNLATQQPDVLKALSAKLEKWNTTLPTEYIKTDDKQD